jgi:hypothetical protein
MSEMKQVHRLAAFAVPAFLIGVGIAVGADVTPSAAADGSTGSYAFTDHSRGTTFSVGLPSAGASAGKFEFTVAGVGLLWPDQKATVDVHSDHSVIVRYDGGGQLDRDAVLDPVFGFNHRSGSQEAVALRLEAQINPDRVTASAQLWCNGVQYMLVDRQPIRNADAPVDAVLTALRNQDWHTLYGSMYSKARAQMTEAAFVAAISAAFAAKGQVTDARTTSSVSYSSGQAGFDTASVGVSVTMSKAGVSHTYAARAGFLWEDDQWKLLSIALDS